MQLTRTDQCGVECTAEIELAVGGRCDVRNREIAVLRDLDFFGPQCIVACRSQLQSVVGASSQSLYTEIRRRRARSGLGSGAVAYRDRDRVTIESYAGCGELSRSIGTAENQSALVVGSLVRVERIRDFVDGLQRRRNPNGLTGDLCVLVEDEASAARNANLFAGQRRQTLVRNHEFGQRGRRGTSGAQGDGVDAGTVREPDIARFDDEA